MPDNPTFWTQYLNALLGLAPEANLPGLQPTSVDTAFIGATDTQAQQNAALYAVANPVPQWSMVYAPSEVGLFTQYGMFLNGLQLTGQNTDPALAKQLSADMSQLRSDLGQLQTDLDSGADPTLVAEDQQVVDGDVTAVQTDLQKINGPTYMVLGPDIANWLLAQNGSKPGSAGNQFTMPTVSQNGSSQVPLYALAENFAQWLAVAEQNRSTGTYQETISFSQSSSSSYEGSFSTQSSSSRSVFFGVYSSETSSWTDIVVTGGQTISYSVTMELPGAQLFTLQPGGWFDGTVLRDFQNGPWVAGSPFANQPAFGSQGLLPAVASQLLVVYGAKVTITFDEETYATYTKDWGSTSSSGVSVGPFYGQTSSSSSSNHWGTASKDDETYTVTIDDNSGISKVLGVVADVLP